MRWVAIVRRFLCEAPSSSARAVGSCQYGQVCVLESFPSAYAIWHVRQRPSTKPSVRLHNVVRRRGGRVPLVIVDRCRRLGEIEIAARAILAEQVGRHYVAARLTARIRPLPRKPNFARYLRDARIKRRLSVVEVADEVGVSTSSIYFWETDHCRPRDANLSALCKVLKLPIRATREMAAA